MTETAPAAASAPSPSPTPAPTVGHVDRVRVTFPRVVRSEWIKLRTLRSTVWCLALIIVLAAGVSLLVAAVIPSTSAGTAEAQRSLQVTVGTAGLGLAQLIAAILGVLIITGEYSTGMIRSTFAAVPKRIPALLAKALVLAVSTFVVAVVSIAISALTTAPILSGKGLGNHLGDGDVLRPLLGGAVYLMLIAVLAFTFGAIIRVSAGGIAAILGLVLVAPGILQLISSLAQVKWLSNVAAFLPSQAGAKMYAFDATSSSAAALGGRRAVEAAASTSGTVDLNSWQGLLVVLAWVVVGIIVSLILVKRRDA
jgi:ABC-2 type transport system permease protein